MDTACSSSLVAAHLGHHALLSGETRVSGMMLVHTQTRSAHCSDVFRSYSTYQPNALPNLFGCSVSGGTNLLLAATTSVRLTQLGALSSDGRSKTLDASADGYGRGEACIVFVACRPGSSDQALLAVMHGEALAACMFLGRCCGRCLIAD